MGYTPPTLYVNKITGGWSLTPPDNTTTDDLTIFANTTDGYSKIVVEGNGNIQLVVPVGYSVKASETTSGFPFFKAYYSTPDTIIENTIDAKNIFLKTTGTGVVKFGTYTAGAATDSTGYITILDAAGNTRKLMVQA